MTWMQAVELWDDSFRGALKGAAMEFGATRVYTITSNPKDSFSLRERLRIADFLEHWALLLRTGSEDEKL